jgi:hypothetical protein
VEPVATVAAEQQPGWRTAEAQAQMDSVTDTNRPGWELRAVNAVEAEATDRQRRIEAARAEIGHEAVPSSPEPAAQPTSSGKPKGWRLEQARLDRTTEEAAIAAGPHPKEALAQLVAERADDRERRLSDVQEEIQQMNESSPQNRNVWGGVRVAKQLSERLVRATRLAPRENTDEAKPEEPKKPSRVTKIRSSMSGAPIDKSGKLIKPPKNEDHDYGDGSKL